MDGTVRNCKYLLNAKFYVFLVPEFLSSLFISSFKVIVQMQVLVGTVFIGMTLSCACVMHLKFCQRFQKHNA